MQLEYIVTDIGMEFSTENCAGASNEKQQTTPDRRNGLSNQDKIRTLRREKKSYTYLGILETDTIK